MNKASHTSSTSGGFTLIEMMVSVTLFITVMVTAVGALLALSAANRKAQTLESVVNNLNIAVDGMVRAIRVGSYYHCGGAPYTATADCAGGNTQFAFVPEGGDVNSPRVVYQYDASSKRLRKSTDSGATWLPITSSQIKISSASFYVIGSARGDTTQPKVLVELKGVVGSSGATQTTFQIQATAVQRLLDL